MSADVNTFPHTHTLHTSLAHTLTCLTPHTHAHSSHPSQMDRDPESLSQDDGLTNMKKLFSKGGPKPPPPKPKPKKVPSAIPSQNGEERDSSPRSPLSPGMEVGMLCCKVSVLYSEVAAIQGVFCTVLIVKWAWAVSVLYSEVYY